jgi:xanthine dehydrogenase molybdopterin-binding subunit B
LDKVQDAIAKNSIHGTSNPIRVGDVNVGFNNSDSTIQGDRKGKKLLMLMINQISGKIYTGDQYFFYMETQTSLVVPTENGLDVFAATQAPSTIQVKKRREEERREEERREEERRGEKRRGEERRGEERKGENMK